MDASEYLVFIPLLIYGISLADLLSEWKRILEPKDRYWPYTAVTLILTEGAIYNIFIYQHLLDELAASDYFTYLSYLIPPVLFLMITQAFTPEKGDDTKSYFVRQRKIVFILYAVFVASHFLHPFDESFIVNSFRIALIGFMLLVAFSKSDKMIYVVIIFWLMSLFTRFYVGLAP